MEDVREQARANFNNAGFTYSDIRESEFYILLGLLSEELQNFSIEVGDPNTHGISTMRISKKKKVIMPKFYPDKSGVMKMAFIRVDSHYFEGREAISFNNDGYVGFAGWADDTNVLPFVRAFNRFVSYLKVKNNRGF